MSYIGRIQTSGFVPGVITINTDTGLMTPISGALSITGGASIQTTKVTENAFTIDYTGGATAFTWNVVAINTVMAINNGYVPNAAASLTFTLPAIAPVGSRIIVTGNYASQLAANRWVIAQNAGQTILREDEITVAGVGHGIRGFTGWPAKANVELVCVVANTGWMVIRQTNGGIERY